MKSILCCIAIAFLLAGCDRHLLSKEDALSLVRSRPEVQNFLKISKEANDKTDVIAEEHDGTWEVGVYVVLPDHMSAFNWYNFDENGHLVSFRDKYDEQGNFICSTTTNPDTCR